MNQPATALRSPAFDNARSFQRQFPAARDLPVDGEPVVFVIDDDASVRQSLEASIRSAGWELVAFSCAQEYLDWPKAEAPGCLVVDVSLPGLNGLELQERFGRDELPIIFTTGRPDIPTTVRAMRAGAVDFLTKPCRQADLLAAIRDALDRSRAALRRMRDSRSLRGAYDSLTRREREVMDLVVAGLRNKLVAARLDISEITVKAHRGQVMRKMGVGSLAELVRKAATLAPAFSRT